MTPPKALPPITAAIKAFRADKQHDEEKSEEKSEEKEEEEEEEELGAQHHAVSNAEAREAAKVKSEQRAQAKLRAQALEEAQRQYGRVVALSEASSVTTSAGREADKAHGHFGLGCVKLKKGDHEGAGDELRKVSHSQSLS
jgi:hypothetical protein